MIFKIDNVKINCYLSKFVILFTVLTSVKYLLRMSCMKVNYDKLWKLLIDKKMKKTDLIGQANISSNVLARMGREEPVSLESIGKICSVFECKIDDILEFDVEDEDGQ